MASWLLLLGALTFAGASAPAGPWDSFNYAPKSKTVKPSSIKEVHGTVRNAKNLVSKGSATLSGSGSWVALDFGIEASALDGVFARMLTTHTGWRTCIPEL